MPPLSVRRSLSWECDTRTHHYRHLRFWGSAPRALCVSLQVVTEFGRPNWKKIIGRVADNHPGQTVGVFVCGPPPCAFIVADRQAAPQAARHHLICATDSCMWNWPWASRRRSDEP